MIFTSNDIGGSLIAADEVMSLCGYQSDVKFKRQKAISIACSLPAASFEYFVVEKVSIQNSANNLVTYVSTHDLQAGARLKPGQFFVFSIDAALRLLLDPQSEPHLWRSELLASANRLIYDLSNGNFIPNLPPRPINCSQNSWPLLTSALNSHLNMQLSAWPNSIIPQNYFQSSLSSLDGSSNLIKRKLPSDDSIDK